MIQACISFYNDGPELLERALRSVKDKADSIIVVDGRYREFPLMNGFKPYSTDGCLDIAKKYADRIVETKIPWYDQVAKRNVYLNLELEDDYYFILDADEELVGELPEKPECNSYQLDIKTHKINMPPLIGKSTRLIKHVHGISYRYRHAFIWANGNIINKQEYALNNIKYIDSCYINHYPDTRPAEWLQADGEYVRVRDENKAQVPQPFVSSPTDLTEMIRLKFEGKRYDGTDPVTHERIQANKKGEWIFCSREKYKQLVADYPRDWKFHGTVKREINIGA